MSDFPKDDDKRLEIVEAGANDLALALDRLVLRVGLPPPPPPTAGSWTIAVFMVADDTLRPFAERDLQEMAKAGSKDVRVLANVQWQKGWASDFRPITFGGPQFRKRDPGGSFTSVVQEFNAFLTSVGAAVAGAGTTAPHRLMIVLWGHAFDLQYGGFGNDGLSMHQIAQAVNNATTPTGTKLAVDILGFDACETSHIDVAKALQGTAARIIGSQIGVPFSGWPYHLILRDLTANTGMDAVQLSKVILDQYYESYRPPRVTATAIDGAANHQGLHVQVLDLAKEIGAGLKEKPLVAVMAEVFQTVKRDRAKPIMDLRDFCEALIALVAAPSAGLTATLVTALTTRASAIATQLAGPPFSGPVVKGHERRGPGVEALHGLACSPYVITDDPSWTLAQRQQLYSALAWPLAPFWVEPPIDYGGLKVEVPPLKTPRLTLQHKTTLVTLRNDLQTVAQNVRNLRQIL